MAWKSQQCGLATEVRGVSDRAGRAAEAVALPTPGSMRSTPANLVLAGIAIEPRCGVAIVVGFCRR